MGKFEDQLLDDLMREHGEDLASAERAPKRRTTRPIWVAAGVAAAGAAAAAFILVPGENPAPNPVAVPQPQPQETANQSDKPAYAVVENADGSVTIAVENLSAVDALNKVLADKNLPAVETRCVQVSEVSRPQIKGMAVTVDELVRKIGSGRVKVTSNADGVIVLYASKCN